MKKKNFIATHTFHSTSAKKEFFTFVKDRKKNSDWWGNETEEVKEKFFKILHKRSLIDEQNSNEKRTEDYALMLQIFVGKGDFFFCHWQSIDEQTIIDRLSVAGMDQFIVTMATPVDFPKMNLDYLSPMISKLK